MNYVTVHAWTFVVLLVALMLSMAICIAPSSLQPQRYRYETITFQNDGYSKQTIYRIDTSTGKAVEVVNSWPPGFGK